MTSSISLSNCPELVALLERYSEPDDTAEQVLSSHIATCPVCAEDEHDLARLLDGYCRAKPVELPHGLEGRLLDLLCRKPRA